MRALIVSSLIFVSAIGSSSASAPAAGFYQAYLPSYRAHLTLNLTSDEKFTGRAVTEEGSIRLRGKVGQPIVIERGEGSVALTVLVSQGSLLQARVQGEGLPDESFALMPGFRVRGVPAAPLSGARVNSNLRFAGAGPQNVQGAGFFTAMAKPSGVVRVSGRLPDGNPWSGALRGSYDATAAGARVPVVAAQGRGAQKQFLSGELFLRDPDNRVGNEAVLRGELHWDFAGNEAVRLLAAGGIWRRPLDERNVLENGIGARRFIFARVLDGIRRERVGLMDPHPYNSPSDLAPLADSEEKLDLSVSPRTGIFRGSFIQAGSAGSSVTRRFTGMLTGLLRDEYEVVSGAGEATTVTKVVLHGVGFIVDPAGGTDLVELVKPPPGEKPEGL
jgi:hypothetical protein